MGTWAMERVLIYFAIVGTVIVAASFALGVLVGLGL